MVFDKILNRGKDMKYVLIILIIASISCSNKENHNTRSTDSKYSTRNKENNPPFSNLSERNINSRHSSKTISTKNNKDYVNFKTTLRKRFDIDFNVIKKGQFNIAHQCSPQKIHQLNDYMNKFYTQIYPQYFKKKPTDPWNIIYFNNKPQYTQKTGSTAYGYYNPESKTLYTYCYSGHGTLWHEMIHAFVDTNTNKRIHQWFNEGLASFYEMAFLINNKVSDGYTNWRMPGLQEAIREKRFVPLKKFMMDWTMQKDFGYASVRFLFCYLWIKNKIIPFVQTYLYDLLPKYNRKYLGIKTIQLLESLIGKNIDEINEEYIHLAKTLKRDQKLKQTPGGS